jgi:flavin-dependent dehydrogenase
VIRSHPAANVERADAVVVGARCAGSAASAALARAGRRVVALDRVHFPADTLSTHLLFPHSVAELAKLGALPRVRALGAPAMPEAIMWAAGMTVRASFTPVDGIDHALCVRRTGLDAALVEAAREAGADIREGARVTDLVWDAGRVTGVRYETREGDAREVRAPLVVGADGRRSIVARLVSAAEPYRASANGRACFYAYFEDPRADWRHVAAQWREGPELGTAFPCDAGLVLVLLMPPVGRAHDFRGSLHAEFLRTVQRIPPLAERLAGGAMVGKVRSALDTTSYFRRSSGPGWALAGDAGHFKDPVTAQGIRDALRFGRLLGEAAAPALDDPGTLDRALAEWERRREDECLEMYQWTNQLGRAEAITPLELELYRRMDGDRERARPMLDLLSRVGRPSEVLTATLMARITIAALARGAAYRRETLRVAVREVRGAIANALERRAARRAC